MTENSRLSTISLKDAEKMVLNFLQEYIHPGVCPLAGNTVYMDRFFLYKYMPLVNNYLHYRIIDVSTIKEIVRYKKIFYFSTNNNVNILFIVCKTIKLGVIYHTIDILKMMIYKI